MPSYINTNISSLNAQRNLNTSQTALSTSLQRLSSGLRINSARDDAAGMAISSRMTSQINGNNQAARNANDGISLAQTAEGDLAQIGTNLQRMRDLAVQASNATNSASDRAALNSEVQSLAAEIDRVAQNSSFNGVKLLDGTFTAQVFQVGAGATANDQISISSIGSARTTQLGGVGATTAATRTSTATTAALVAGDVTLNGFQVGASTAGAAPGQSTASAIQIAAAINGISANSSVTATANATTVTGPAAATVFTAIAANTFQINGINVGAVAAGTTAQGQGANVAAAINLVSAQTGVTATASATTGVLTLTATDGRDIQINATTPATKAAILTQTGLATANVGVQGTSVLLGAYTTLTTTDSTDQVSVTVDGLTLQAATVVGAGGVLAATIATSMNTFLTTNTGYTAYLTSTGAALGTTVAGADITAGVTLRKADGTAVDVLVQFTDGAGTGNPVGAPSGGFASVTNDVTVATPTPTNFAAGTGQVQNHGTVTLNSTSASGIVVGGANVARAGLTTGTTTATTVSSVSAISAVDISTAAGALSALSAIDGALANVNSSRASLGAFQNRFASVVTSLQTTSENLTASRSRIMDTDFAAETSSLTRNQILQQAGTAMLAQANQIPNGVLALLR